MLHIPAAAAAAAAADDDDDDDAAADESFRKNLSDCKACIGSFSMLACTIRTIV